MKIAALALITTLGLGGIASADPQAAAPRTDHRAERAEMRQMLFARFDANHDGQLDPQERRRAVHALRRLARQLSREDRQPGDRRRLDRNAAQQPGAAQPLEQ